MPSQNFRDASVGSARPRGLIKATIPFVADASGNCTITDIGAFHGRLVGVGIGGGAVFNAGNAILTLTDVDSGAVLSAIDTDTFKVACTATAATDLFGATAHGLVAGDKVRFVTVATAVVPALLTDYFVIAAGLTADVFAVSATLGGATINVDADSAACPFVKVNQFFRPSAVVRATGGAVVSPQTSYSNDADRDIELSGNIKVTVAQGGNLGAGNLYLIVDEGRFPKSHVK